MTLAVMYDRGGHLFARGFTPPEARGRSPRPDRDPVGGDPMILR